jgi:hypothetical protein
MNKFLIVAVIVGSLFIFTLLQVTYRAFLEDSPPVASSSQTLTPTPRQFMPNAKVSILKKFLPPLYGVNEPFDPRYFTWLKEKINSVTVTTVELKPKK